MRAIWLLVVLIVMSEACDAQVAPEAVGPDERYKTDILVIIAHPDDETGDVAGYLARAVFDQHRRVAVIYTTHAEAGPDVHEGGRALGAVREIEARRGLDSLGIYNVWFISGRHTNSQNVLHSLENMDHGSVLAEAVRLIRLTRPEVMITWLPMPVAGESHADHQAASVIATEAFDLAGDPSAFSEQLYTVQPHDRSGHDSEGLQSWQPKKIYYYTDAFDAACPCWARPPQPSPFRKNFLEGAGPSYFPADVSPTKKMPYARLSATEASFYSAPEIAEPAKKAMESRDFKDYETPMRFILGKSLVAGKRTDDIFEGIEPGPIPFARVSNVSPPIRSELSFIAGGPWDLDRQLWRAHGLDTVASLLEVPEFSIYPGQKVDIPLIIRNGSEARQSVALSALLPKGWTESGEYSVFPLAPQSMYSVHRTLRVSPTAKSGWYEVQWKAQAGGQQIGSVRWHIYVTTLTASDAVPESDG